MERSISMRTLAAAVFGIAIGTAGVAGAQEGWFPFVPSVTPILSCVKTDDATGTMEAYFGYASSYADTVTIQPGTVRNSFAPGAGDLNQPAEFQPGVHPLAFAVTIPFTSDSRVLAWALDGNSASAEAGLVSQACPEPFPVAGPPGPPGPPGPAGVAGPPGGGPGSAIRTVTGRGTRSSATVSCSAGEALVSGGGSCSTWLLGSMPSGNGWRITCRGTTATATATAVCARD
jgi:hypothetical protein